jgi:hypothetical protein
MNSLAPQVQQVLRRDPHGGDLCVFRKRRGAARLRAQVNRLAKSRPPLAAGVGRLSLAPNSLPEDIDTLKQRWSQRGRMPCQIETELAARARLSG